MQIWPQNLVGNFLNYPNRNYFTITSQNHFKSLLPALLFHISSEFFALFMCKANHCFFHYIFFWTAFKYFYFSKDLCTFTEVFILFSTLSHTVLLTLPSLHIISLIPDNISTRSWKIKCVCFLLLVMCSTWNVSLLNCTKEYLCMLCLHIKSVLLLSDVHCEMMCHRFFPQLV